MDASLVALHPGNGELLGQWRLADPYLSMRHLAWDARHQRLGIALQAEHPLPRPAGKRPCWPCGTVKASRHRPNHPICAATAVPWRLCPAAVFWWAARAPTWSPPSIGQGRWSHNLDLPEACAVAVGLRNGGPVAARECCTPTADPQRRHPGWRRPPHAALGQPLASLANGLSRPACAVTAGRLKAPTRSTASHTSAPVPRRPGRHAAKHPENQRPAGVLLKPLRDPCGQKTDHRTGRRTSRSPPGGQRPAHAHGLTPRQRNTAAI